jgi:hypothetical protein
MRCFLAARRVFIVGVRCAVAGGGGGGYGHEIQSANNDSTDGVDRIHHGGHGGAGGGPGAGGQSILPGHHDAYFNVKIGTNSCFFPLSSIGMPRCHRHHRLVLHCVVFILPKGLGVLVCCLRSSLLRLTTKRRRYQEYHPFLLFIDAIFERRNPTWAHL